VNVGAEKEEVGRVFDGNVAEGLLVHIGFFMRRPDFETPTTLAPLARLGAAGSAKGGKL